MELEIVQPNTCLRGCCASDSIPLHLSPSSYSLLFPIARGAESVVYEGMLNEKTVAVKKPILSTSDDINKFHKELQLLCNLDHPGLAKLVAAHSRPPNYMFFFQFYQSRSLSEKIHKEVWIPKIDQVLMISVKIAKALQYLHSLGIVHRDVKPANILLDNNLCPHLADFGLAEYKIHLKKESIENWRSYGKPTGGFHKKNMVGTLIYMAPEILRRELHTEKSDVYSFGVSINELLTGVVPYTNLRTEAQAHTVLEMNYTEQQLTASVVSEGLRPALACFESGAPGGLLSLIERCWDADPQNRPSFADIVLGLSPLWEQHSAHLENERIEIPVPFVSHENHTLKMMNRFQTYPENVNWFAQGESSYKSATLVPNSSIKPWLGDHLVYHPIISSGSFATCGKRETMEDTHFLMPRMCNEEHIHLFGIFDGHRGAEAAEFSSRALPGFLQMSSFMSRPSDALVDAFMRTDVAFRNVFDSHCKLAVRDRHPGCTALAALIVGNRLFVANAGDCRTILCRAGQPVALTRDHVASCAEERERVISAGGEVQWQVDTWRVGPPGLQVTRSIGDVDLKPAVTAKPEVTETLLSSEDEFMVLGSDGLWDALNSNDVVRLINDTVKEPTMCAKRLATEAAERGSTDNITAIVVFLSKVSTSQRVY